MFLKSLTLKGFKSFADATVLDLEPGVTVVVGPNGSGKSNVVDAIAWVLGAQAPSAVRSQKMDDVIFAGTEKRPALGRAEVSLTIDNASKLLPIDFEEVTVTRTLFRTGESEYAINGVSCRLLDLQDLLSDSGVGRQQHVIVSQGQIDAVLNARPEERRLIIEEAAGVLKYRKRKEKSERRLQSTEANLTRVQDLLREVRRQLRPLERQADAARRHGSLVDELGGLRLFLAGRELDQLKTRSDTNRAERNGLATTEATLVRDLAALDAEVMAAESQLAESGDVHLSAALTRCESLRERARGVAALLAERGAGLRRERDATIDLDVIASLEAEAAGVAADLREVDEQAENLVPDAERLEVAEVELAVERDRFQSELGDGTPAPSGAAAEVRGELGALRQAVARADAERQRLVARRAELLDAKVALDARVSRLAAGPSSGPDAEPVELRIDAALEHRHHAGETVDASRAAVAAAERERESWTARADALALALDEARATSGVGELEGLDGVIGTLLELVEIDAGWAESFEAACGDAIAAVIVSDAETARRAVDRLHHGDAAGAVLALGVSASTPTPPPVGRPIRGHVRSPQPGVDTLLDRLVGGAVVVDDTTAAIDAALDHPLATIVTPDGSRFGASGWRINAPRTGATGAALEEAVSNAESAIARLDEARAEQAAAVEVLSAAKTAVVDLERERTLSEREQTMASEARQEADRAVRENQVELDGIEHHLAEISERLHRDQARTAELAELLPGLEAADEERAEKGRQLTLFRSRLDERARAVAALRTDLEVRAAAVEQRGQLLRDRRAEIERRLGRFEAERERSGGRRVDLDRRLGLADQLTVELEGQLHAIDGELGTLRDRHQRLSDEARAASTKLESLRRDRSAAERELTEVRTRLQKLDIDRAEIDLRLETALESLRRDHGCSPREAIEATCPELAEGVSAAARIRELERELRLMGPINPLALEEFEALTERHDFLQEQLDDVRSSRRELNKVIRAIDEEIVNVFSSAYADVAESFAKLFGSLFPGGQGSLRLTDPSNLLETGVEVQARPSGKNVKKLSLLSGGERSLTALAFLFAVFRSRPSPFYVMDEVEAALDDVNLHRFLNLVAEFRDEAQLLIVSHQKRTMEAADCLYGVSMAPGGSSKVLSERAGAEPVVA